MKTPILKLTLTMAALGLCAGHLEAQNYDKIETLKQMNRTVRGIRPTTDGEHYTVLEGNSIFRYSYADSAVREAQTPRVSGDFRITDYLFSPDEQALLIASGETPIYRHSYTTHYFLRTPEEGMRPIFRQLDGTRDASFSPDGRMIVCSSDNDLYIYDIATDKTRRITSDGRWNEVINGTTDWVYEEEYGFTKAYAFSPDSRRIAFLRFDESRVPVFEMMRYDGELYNHAFTFKYPKAGDPNSTVSVWVYDIRRGRTVSIDTGTQTDQYIPHLGWTPDGRLYYYRMNRKQNHFEVVLCDDDGTQRVIYDERSPRYVDRLTPSTVTFLDHDRFVVREETSAGWMHLYLHSLEQGRLHPITEGQWEVTELVSCTPEYIYYLSTEGSALRNNLYRIRPDGSDKERLTVGDGYYAIAPGRGMQYYISTFSNVSTPNRVEVCDAHGRVIRTLHDNAALCDSLAGRPVKEFFTLVTERGDTLNAWMLRPRDFDPARQYPVLLTQYSGPGSQQVRDRWNLDWEDALVDAGYVVVCADGRGTGFRGEAFKKSTYGNLGALEVEDQLSTARYMASLPWVDAARMGIYGWSYGGFMALGCAFKGDGLFRMAIAVAPVTSWRYYDSIYTETYNGLPQENAAGYDENSPIHFADRLNDAKTHLLIIHGTADDNVHFQNVMEVARALNKHQKRYDMMVYPDQNHSMQPNDMRNVRQKMVDYTIKHL